MMSSAQSPWLAEMFPSRIRYTGFALAREVTAPIAGGIAPLIAVALLSAGNGSPHLVAWYVVENLWRRGCPSRKLFACHWTEPSFIQDQAAGRSQWRCRPPSWENATTLPRPGGCTVRGFGACIDKKRCALQSWY
jgi:hypothetical protein